MKLRKVETSPVARVSHDVPAKVSAAHGPLRQSSGPSHSMQDKKKEALLFNRGM